MFALVARWLFEAWEIIVAFAITGIIFAVISLIVFWLVHYDII